MKTLRVMEERMFVRMEDCAVGDGTWASVRGAYIIQQDAPVPL